MRVEATRRDVVLIVDDEPVIRRVLRQTLEIAEYAVLEAADGVEAISVLETGEHSISAVFSDITMPRLDGLALVEMMQHTHPTIPIVLASGMHSHGTLPAPIARRITAFLDKPYSRASVLAAVAAAIDAGAAA